MLTHRGFSAWIACEGQALPEYLVAVEEEVHQVSCWIPSEEGKSFAVFWRDNTDPAPAPAPEHPAQPIDSCGFITLDGLVVPGRFLFGTGTASRAGVRSGPNTEKPFVFLKVGEEEGGGGGVDASSSSKSRKDLGTIILRIRRVLRVEKCPANPIKAVPSKVLGKRKTGDVGIGFGDDVPAYYQSPATWEVQPYPEDAHLGAASYVTFVFRYRSAEFLESQGIMPSPRPQPQHLASASAAGSSHYRTGSSANTTNDKVQAKDKGKGSKGKAKETGLETPAMTPLPFPMRSLPPPPPTAQQQSSGVLPVYPPPYPPHYPPVYPPHPEVQPQQSQQQVGTTLVEAEAGSAEVLTTPAPNPDVYPPMTPTPSATPANDNATTGNTTTLGNGNENDGVGPAVMRRIVSAPIVPTQQQQQLRLQEQQLQEERELEEERDHEHEPERECELQHGHQRREASSARAAGVSVSPPRKRLKQSDFLANGPYRMRRPSDMKRSMSWRAPNSKPLSSLSASTSASVTSTSVTSTSTTSPSNAASASTASASETAPVNDRVGITFNNPFTSAPLIRSISNPHPHPQLNPRAQLNPQSQAQSRSFANAYADAVGLGPTQLPPYSQPEPNNHSQPHTQQPQTLARATHYRSQQQTLAQARAQCRHLPYRRPSINTTRALQQKRQQRQMQASTLPPPPTSSSPFSSSPETLVTEEFGRGGEASIDASPVLGSGGGGRGGIGGGGGGDAEGGDGDGGVEAKRRGSRRVVYEDLGGIGPRDFGLDDVGGESDGGGGGNNSASSSQESALGLGLGLGMAMGNGPGLSSFEGDQYGGYDFAGFGGFGGFGGVDGGGGEDIGGGAGVGVGGAGDGGMGTALGLEGADPYGGFFQSGY